MGMPSEEDTVGVRNKSEKEKLSSSCGTPGDRDWSKAPTVQGSRCECLESQDGQSSCLTNLFDAAARLVIDAGERLLVVVGPPLLTMS